MWALFNDAETQITVAVSAATLAAVGLVLRYAIVRMRRAKAPPPAAGAHAFDGIVEGDNPTPWGMHLIMAALVSFGGWYVLFGYPIASWTQAGQYREEVEGHREAFEAKWAGAEEGVLVQMGESLFNANCVACHGYTGEGQNGLAANLVEYGTAAHVARVVRVGSKGAGYLTPAMPPQEGVLRALYPEAPDKALADVAAYVVSLHGGAAGGEGDPAAGGEVFQRACASCHGPAGKGDGPGGAVPNFAKDLTQYGTPADVERTLRHGKRGLIGVMPNFEKMGALSPLQYQALGLYVTKGLK